ncbi:DUF4406 domain-containing protein [Vibrio rotiferianus]|uniref:DUF4406 domain-containing protein n=1 Tax=Vibrio rotiferianus TaxID=190895 RepID=UPI0015F66434|nr:DUF4406 domain-containing protein [Vibrio rotiferianus]
MKTKIYIAGPVSGLPEFNRHNFHLADTLLTKAGNVVLNPAMLPDGLSQPEYMDICCAMVRCADTLFMLDDWERSDGAMAEYHLAKKLGKSILFQGEDNIPKSQGTVHITVNVCQVYGTSHHYQPSIDGGTMVCECGAWK